MRRQKRKKEADKSGQGSSDTSGNAVGSPSGAESELRDNQQSGAPLVTPGTVRTGSPTGRPRGPRTAQGKYRSKHNALKHGIFSEVVVLKAESRDE